MWEGDNKSSFWSTDSTDHSVSQPIPMPMQRRSNFQTNETAGGLLSPKSTEIMGLKLVNYIFDDSSPSVKELENRLQKVKISYVSSVVTYFFFYY